MFYVSNYKGTLQVYLRFCQYLLTCHKDHAWMHPGSYIMSWPEASLAKPSLAMIRTERTSSIALRLSQDAGPKGLWLGGEA